METATPPPIRSKMDIILFVLFGMSAITPLGPQWAYPHES